MKKENYHKIFSGQLIEIIKIKGELEKVNIIPVIKNKNELANYFIELINDENDLQKTGQSSKNIFMKNRGAIDIITKDLLGLL